MGKTIKRIGKFGEFVKEYEKARKPYPAGVFHFISKILNVDKSIILDLGCGTGISTRQIAKFGTVFGCDPDPLMLNAAKKHKKVNGEKYMVGSADKIPFADNSFDIITAFSAFHWFDNKKSIEEIKRVLKPNGIIFVINKKGLKSWGEGYRKTIIKSIGRDIAKFKDNSYNPKQSLLDSGFSKVKVHCWKYSEIFDLENVIEYIQSVSIWNSVPASDRAKALKGVRRYFSAMIERKGKIERKIVAKVVMGFKS